MSSTNSLVRIVDVSCPRHGPKSGLWMSGQMVPFPIVIEQRYVESTQPLCFECKAVGVRRNCTVIMEPVGTELG